MNSLGNSLGAALAEVGLLTEQQRQRIEEERQFTEKYEQDGLWWKGLLTSVKETELACVKLTKNQEEIIRELAEGPIAQVRRLPESIGSVIKDLKKQLQREVAGSDKWNAIRALVCNLQNLRIDIHFYGKEDPKRVVAGHKFPFFPKEFCCR